MYWLIKCLILTIILIIQTVYIIRINLTSKVEIINEITRYQLILQFFLFYLFLCLITYLYEALFKLDFSILEEVSEFYSHLKNKILDNFSIIRKQTQIIVFKAIKNNWISNCANFYQKEQLNFIYLTRMPLQIIIIWVLRMSQFWILKLNIYRKSQRLLLNNRA